MKKLFIIGNGFDCYMHGLKTKYSDFRDYIISNYPNYIDQLYIPTETLHDDGYYYDENDLISFLISNIDLCNGIDWNDLESSLGKKLKDTFIFLNGKTFDIEEKESYISATIQDNSEASKVLLEASSKFMILLRKWVKDELSKISYRDISRNKDFVDYDDSLFLNFNYTRTLENVYDIDNKNICHIHGSVDSEDDEIFFGHIEEEYNEYSCKCWGIDDCFGSLERVLTKNTNLAYIIHKSFFDKLYNITDIYSHGFSFSEVDMFYIEIIASQNNPKDIVWHFNEYDSLYKRDYIERIKNFGFKTNSY